MLKIDLFSFCSNVAWWSNAGEPACKLQEVYVLLSHDNWHPCQFLFLLDYLSSCFWVWVPDGESGHGYQFYSSYTKHLVLCKRAFISLLHVCKWNWTDRLLQLSFFYCCRNIKNAVIGNKAKKSSFIRLDVIPKIIELLVQDDTGIEFVVESVVLLGSLARGMTY